MSMARILVTHGARGVATLTLNRPERGNAYDDVMLRELARALALLGADGEVRVVMLKAAGKHFCVGADIAWHRSNQREVGGGTGPKLIDVLSALDGCTKPTIAVLHGAAAGGGLALAACCDITLAVEGAFFSIPEVRLGLVPGPLVPIFLRAMGYRAFRRYGLSGERFATAEALRLGLVHQVLAQDAIEAELTRIVDELVLGAPGAIASLKAISARLAGPAVTDSLVKDLEHSARGMLTTTEAREGVASFLEKRKPNWVPKG